MQCIHSISPFDCMQNGKGQQITCKHTRTCTVKKHFIEVIEGVWSIFFMTKTLETTVTVQYICMTVHEYQPSKAQDSCLQSAVTLATLSALSSCMCDKTAQWCKVDRQWRLRVLHGCLPVHRCRTRKLKEPLSLACEEHNFYSCCVDALWKMRSHWRGCI